MTDKPTLRKWKERASRGTSGDMVWGILQDWETEQNTFLQAIEQVKPLGKKEIGESIWEGYRTLTEAKGLDFDNIEAREPDGEWGWSEYPDRPIFGESDLDYYNKCIAKASHQNVIDQIKKLVGGK